MCKSTYKQIVEDFSFLSEYGFLFDRVSHHNVMPSIVFKKNIIEIQIGFSFEDSKFFIVVYDLSKANYFVYNNSEHILDGVNLIGKSYKTQLSQVKGILRNYLENMTQKL